MTKAYAVKSHADNTIYGVFVDKESARYFADNLSDDICARSDVAVKLVSVGSYKDYATQAGKTILFLKKIMR